MNYEKKYKEALGWMQSLYDGLHGATKEDAEKYFPELKETEDERMKKAIIAYINHGQHNGISNKDMIAWLEKQGEQPTDKIEPTPAWSEEDEEMLKWLCLIIHSLRLRKEITLKEESELGEWMDKWLNHNPQTKQGKQLNPDKVIEWLKITIKERAENYGVYKATRLILPPYNSIEDFINDFKEDFGL